MLCFGGIEADASLALKSLVWQDLGDISDEARENLEALTLHQWQ